MCRRRVLNLIFSFVDTHFYSPLRGEFHMLQDISRNKWQRFLPVAIGAILAIALVGIPGGRALLARAFRSLRTQKVQAVNGNLSPFTDPNAKPALHQMIAQTISDDVGVAAHQPHQPPPASTPHPPTTRLYPPPSAHPQ